MAGVEKKKRNRNANRSEAEIRLLVEDIKENFAAYTAPFSQQETRATKTKLWVSLTRRINTLGASREWKDVRKKWQGMKQEATNSVSSKKYPQNWRRPSSKIKIKMMMCCLQGPVNHAQSLLDHSQWVIETTY
jgi:hypothetical protein